jgi:hypothetical protein
MVVRGGMSARGVEGGGRSSEVEVMFAREEEGKARRGSVRGEEGSRRGVEVLEFKVEVGRTRFARRKVKNAM